ncbi:uncharacterized protein E6C27_scaffold65G00170 [Cucumis melo var. makuwa]|uniref:Reverse transcriptase n=1 Tax=Cucumis melo var. makuwa TaxID=1194695 RepID=A0A5A7SUA8_CUCMM|nr:uncharacterized protein E6C27_scaffold65G00170 [Cucumis melo var. makuwa]
MPPILFKCQEANVTTSYLIDEEDWRQLIIDYLEHGILPKDSRHKTEVRRRASHFIYYKGTLYRRSLEGLFLRCLGKEESIKALKKACRRLWSTSIETKASISVEKNGLRPFP